MLIQDFWALLSRCQGLVRERLRVLTCSDKQPTQASLLGWLCGSHTTSLEGEKLPCRPEALPAPSLPVRLPDTTPAWLDVDSLTHSPGPPHPTKAKATARIPVLRLGAGSPRSYHFLLAHPEKNEDLARPSCTKPGAPERAGGNPGRCTRGLPEWGVWERTEAGPGHWGGLTKV